MGLVSARTALAELAQRAGGAHADPRRRRTVSRPAARPRLRGIDADGDYYGYSLALGSAEVSLLQQANAYRTLANGGLWSPLRLAAGRSTTPAGRRVMSPEACVPGVRHPERSRGPRRAPSGSTACSPRRSGAAVKTGTSKDMRDNWCIGYSRPVHRRRLGRQFRRRLDARRLRRERRRAGVARDHARAAPRAAFASHPRRRAALVARHGCVCTGHRVATGCLVSRGTEVSRVEVLQRNAATARITSPANGAIIALDPDIPAANQRIVLADTRRRGRSSATTSTGARWARAIGRGDGYPSPAHTGSRSAARMAACAIRSGSSSAAPAS